nr:MAG TPA: hypothetical protein [Caudoviricetes sp.]
MSQIWDNSTVTAVHMLICHRITGEAGCMAAYGAT